MADDYGEAGVPKATAEDADRVCRELATQVERVRQVFLAYAARLGRRAVLNDNTAADATAASSD